MKKERLSNGKLVLKTLSDRLTAEFCRGFSRSNLQNMRLFFLAYCNRLPPKRQMPSGKLIGEKSHTASGESVLVASTARPDRQPHFQLRRKREALVELTLPKDAHIHASQYHLYLPSKDDLKQRLLEWAGEDEQ